MAGVGGDAVDGALVTFDLAQTPQRVCVPQLEHPAPAAAQQDRGRGDHAQRTHPVAVGVGDLLSGGTNNTGSVKTVRSRLSRLPIISDWILSLVPDLQQVFTVQVPLLDAVVSRAAEEHVPLDHQRLDAVVMRRLEVVRGTDAPQRAFSHVEQLGHTEGRRF